MSSTSSIRPTSREQQRSVIPVVATQLPSPRFQAWADASGAAAEVPYTVYVHTADVAGAGTDANVYLELNGDFGSSGPRRLHASWKNCFERGHVDEFALGSVELGDLRSVRVGHDGDQSYRRRNGCANVCIRITAKGGG